MMMVKQNAYKFFESVTTFAVKSVARSMSLTPSSLQLSTSIFRTNRLYVSHSLMVSRKVKRVLCVWMWREAGSGGFTSDAYRTK